MDNVNHLNELSIQSQLSILEKLVADAEQSTDARRDFEAQPRAVFQKLIIYVVNIIPLNPHIDTAQPFASPPSHVSSSGLLLLI